MEIETLGKVRLNPDRIEKVRGKLMNKRRLYPYSVTPEKLVYGLLFGCPRPL